MSNLWVHPSLILILGSLLIPLVPARLKRAYLLLIPILVFARIVAMSKGTFGEVAFLNWTLVFGRVDALSSVFGYIMSLMCILGTLYGLHVKDNGQHIASWIYVAGSIGCIYAGDFITLFLFWEVMAFSSVFLVWYRRRPESLAAGYRYLLVHVAGGLALGYEVVWSQSVVPFMSTRSFAFSVMLVTYLFGLALGAALFARWADRVRDPWGMFCYIRDVSTGEFWSAAYQPTLKKPERYEAIFSDSKVEFRRRDDEINTHTQIAVSPEDDI